MSHFFHSDCNITDGMYKGVGGWGGGAGGGGGGGGRGGGGWGWWGGVGSRRRVNPTIKRHTAVECVQ